MPDTDDTSTDTDADTDDAGQTDKDLAAEVNKWKALARKHEQQAKANADAARELAELKDQDKSESEKIAERLAEAERRAADAESKALRMEVAASKGLPASMVKRLTGSTKEDLEADADELLESIKPTGEGDAGNNGGPAGGRPVENLSGGGAPAAEPDPDVRAIVDSIPRM